MVAKTANALGREKGLRKKIPNTFSTPVTSTESWEMRVKLIDR